MQIVFQSRRFPIYWLLFDWRAIRLPRHVRSRDRPSRTGHRTRRASSWESL